MMERTLMALAAGAAIAAAAAVGVISAFFAVFAAIEPLVGTAWAAAIIAAASALVVALAGFAAKARAEGDRRRAVEAEPDASLVEILLKVVRDRPMLSAAAAVAAGVYALRHPQLLAAVVRAFMDRPGPDGRN
ncbi:MAG: hypothetical protein ACOY4K_02915 [Pseudomonadota bacterium]